jgi:hypothetical protein
VWEERIHLPALAHGEGSPAVIALYGREAVEDLEMREAAGLLSDGDTAIEQIGLAFQIATRRTAWVAVSEEPTVDPTAPIRRERIPHALPYGMSAEGLGLRQPWGFSARPALLFACQLAAEQGLPRRLAVPPDEIATLLRSVEPGPRLLAARLVLRKDRDLVVEVDVTDLVEWYARDVRAIWEDGSEVAAAIVDEGTTRPGVVAAGQVIRLALRLKGDGRSDAPVRVELKSLGRAFHLSLRR